MSSMGFVIQDCCGTFTRSFMERDGGRFPPSDHSPRCKHYKAFKYFAVITQEQRCFYMQHQYEVEAFCKSETAFDVEEVWLTSDQFYKLQQSKIIEMKETIKNLDEIWDIHKKIDLENERIIAQLKETIKTQQKMIDLLKPLVEERIG